MMVGTFKRIAVAGLALGLGSLSSFAGESKVYRHGDWTVTITPRKSDDPVPPRPQYVKPRPAPQKGASDPRKSTDDRVLIRPISFNQTEASPQPVPVLNSTVEPASAQTQAPLPPSLNSSLSTTPTPMPVVAGAESSAPCTNCDLPVITPKPVDEELRPTVIVPQTALYRDIYFSIPYNRVEYYANPSYRHDATMELLFNQMRPTVIQRGVTYANPYPGYGYGYGYGMTYPGYNGYGYGDPPYYPYSYGLRIHTSR